MARTTMTTNDAEEVEDEEEEEEAKRWKSIASNKVTKYKVAFKLIQWDV